MLRACRRALRPGGKIAFLAIQPTPGLGQRRRRKANKAGPVSVAVPTSYPSLLSSAGFAEIETSDLTDGYRQTQIRWIHATESREAATRSVMGDAWYDDRVASRASTLAAIEDGLLSRFMYSAVRPGRMPEL